MEEKIKLKRGISPTELDMMNIPSLEFTGEWQDAFGSPQATGVWFILGDSGNGKTRFTVKLSKYLTQFGKVIVNSLEEGPSRSMQKAWREENMKEVSGKIMMVRESMEHLCIRMNRRKCPRIIVIDSIQYTKLTTAQFYAFAEKYEEKFLIIFISQATGSEPKGAVAEAIKYHANQKIWVEGHRAFSKGRSIGPKGYYTIWDQGAAAYWGDK